MSISHLFLSYLFLDDDSEVDISLGLANSVQDIIEILVIYENNTVELC